MTSSIRLYLDTSDYAAMYNATPGTQIVGVRDYLLQMKESGRIEIGLSYHVVFELLQEAEPKYREDRLSRARLLKLLCDRNAFPYPTDMPQGHRYEKNGLWVPRIWLEEIEIERIVRLVIKRIISCLSTNRHQRRAFSKREYFVSWAFRNPKALQKVLPEVWPLQFGEAFYKNGDFIRYLSGSISRKEANIKIRFFITDPEMVYQTWFENYGRENPMPKTRDPIANLITVMIEKLNAMLDDYSSLEKDIKKALRSTSNPLISEDRQQIMEVRQSIKEFGSEITSPSEMAKNLVWKKAVGNEGALIAAQVFHAFHREKRTIKPSDAIDLLHSMYLPHADLWRGDKAFSTMLIKHRVNFHERVVTNLLDLPSRIEAEIANRSS